MKHLKLFFALFAMLALGVGNAWAETAKVDFSTLYSADTDVSSTTFSVVEGISLAFDKGTGSTAPKYYKSGTAVRLYAKGTMTVSSTIGKITKITLAYGSSDKTNTISVNCGSFSTPDWTGEADEVIFTIDGTSGHRRIKSVEVTYTPSAGGGEDPGEGGGEDPVDPTPGAGGTGTINFNSNAVKINAASVTSDDNLGNTWTITTVGTTSFTSNTAYYQVGSSSKPATSITFTTTLPSEGNITAFSAKFGGFSGTAGNVTLKVDDTSVGTGSLNASNDVTVSNSSQATGKKLTVTVTGIAKGVKVYYISYTYTTSSGGSEPETPTPSVSVAPTSHTFATTNVGETATQEFTITAENTTATLSASIDNTTDFAISAITGDKVTVTYRPQSAGDHTATMTVKAGEEASTTVALAGKAKTPLAPIAGGVIDILNQAWSDVSGTNYKDVAEKTAENTGHSNAKYVAQCAGDKSSIQLRSNNSNSGVVSTVSGGVVKRIEVEWHADTDAARTLQIYGSNTAYTAATDLYGDAKGELLGELNKGEGETTLDFSEWTGDYKYIGFRSKSGAMYLTTVTITWLPTISKVTIDDQIENGSVSVSGAADLNSVAAGTILTLSNTPETNYKFSAYDVYKTDDATTKVTVADGKFTMPEFDVTISATFEAAKTLNSIEITTSATQTTFWQGETFNHNGLKVTAHFDGAADEDVTDKVTVTGSTATAGTQTVTVSYTEGTTTKTATYTITVKDIPNTKETAYSVADAFDIIDKLGETEGIYITGTISQVDSYSSTYKSITYWISADGTTTNQLQVYGGKGLDNADFASKLDLTVGDQVIVVGKLKKYNSTYEFDANNYLASHTPTIKDPAGLAYATTSYTANVGEEFTTPELTNPHDLVVTYSTSDASKATVDVNTGAVTIVAAGEVTITASTTGDATHDAGSASYTITISNPAMAVATLPFTFNSGKADIENTAGMTQEGLGSDYSATTKLKFDGTGDCVIIHFNSQAEKLAYEIKGNSFSGGKFTVQQSADGSAYTDVVTYTELGDAATKEHELAAESRYVKFIYTNKENGNVGLGNITISKPDTREEAGLAWDPSSVTLTQGDAFTAPTLQNPKSVAGITYESSNDEVATVTTAGVIALATSIGTATITATFDGDATYKPATATCTITVNEYIETLDGEWQLVTDASKLQAGMEIIIASVEVDGKYYAMSKASDNGNNRTAVESTISGEKLNPAVGTSVLTLVDAGNGTFALQAGNGKYLYAASSTSNHLKEKDKIDVNGQWTITIADSKATIKAEASSNRNWIRYNNSSNMFSCYASGQKDIALYAKVPEHRRTTSTGRYGTICLPGNIVKCLGATLYEVAGKDGLRVVFDEVLTPKAGMPYIFLAHNAEVLFYCGDETAAAGNYNSLYGTFSVLQDAQLDGMYMVQNNKIVKCAATGCGVAEYRAYFNGAELEALGSAPAPMPGRRRITMGTESENAATGTEDVIAPAGQTLKLIENGQLIIIRGGEKFNAQGIKF